MIAQISAAVIAVAFVVLTVYLIQSLRKLNQTLDSVDSTLQELKPRLEDVATESEKTLKEARLILEDARLKSQQTDAFFQAVNGMGNSLQELSSSITRTASVQKERLSNVAAIGSVVIELLKKWRSEKNPDNRKRKRVK